MINLIYRIDRKIYNFLYPSYDCEDCIGMREWGCYCAYYHAYSPDDDAPKYIKRLRKLYKFFTGKPY